MAHIYIFSPSSAVRDKAAFRRGVKRLQAQGHQVEVDEAALASHMRFAGDDATRIVGAAVLAHLPFALDGSDFDLETDDGHQLSGNEIIWRVGHLPWLAARLLHHVGDLAYLIPEPVGRFDDGRYPACLHHFVIPGRHDLVRDLLRRIPVGAHIVVRALKDHQTVLQHGDRKSVV